MGRGQKNIGLTRGPSGASRVTNRPKAAKFLAFYKYRSRFYQGKNGRKSTFFTCRGDLGERSQKIFLVDKGGPPEQVIHIKNTYYYK